MGRSILTIAVLIAFAAAPAAAADQANGKADQEQPKEKKICRTEQVTGSLVAQRRICMTKAEWDKLAGQTKQDIEDIQRNHGAIPRTAGSNGSTAGFQ